MTITKLLNTGRQNCGIIEKAADAILTFPRIMWHGKNVNVVKSGDHYEAKHESNKANLTAFTGKALKAVSGIYPVSGLFQATIGLLYVAACIVATPLFFLGAALKKLAVKTDKTANLYQRIVETANKKEKLASQIETLKKVKEATDAKIKELQPIQEAVKQQPALKKYMFANPSKQLDYCNKYSEKITVKLAKLEPQNAKIIAHFEDCLQQYSKTQQS